MFITNEYASLSFASGSATGDGSTTDFVTANDIKDEKLVWVTLDGLNRNLTTHYTINVATRTISFLTAPAVGQLINIKYFVK